MDPNRDNPILRFTTFWWAFWTFMMFALLLAVIVVFNRKPPATVEDVVAKTRYATKARVDQAQAAVISKEALAAAIPVVAAKLAASKPAAVEKPEQVVPGSPTAKQLTAEPAPAPATAPAPMPGTPPAAEQTPPQP